MHLRKTEKTESAVGRRNVNKVNVTGRKKSGRKAESTSIGKIETEKRGEMAEIVHLSGHRSPGRSPDTDDHMFQGGCQKAVLKNSAQRWSIRGE